VAPARKRFCDPRANVFVTDARSVFVTDARKRFCGSTRASVFVIRAQAFL
jgi:hypothetical protein